MSKKKVEKKIPTEVYSRSVGYFRPVQQWNLGKQSEFADRKYYKIREEQIDGNKKDSKRDT